MNRPLSKSSTLVVVLLAAFTIATGCYSFKAARQDIADKEAELRRLHNAINQETNRSTNLGNSPYAK